MRRLVATQFPQWKDLYVVPIAINGWDNRTFHIGQDMIVRLPSAVCYETQVEKEHTWLPRLAPLLPLSIPEPLAIGEPAHGYPCRWSVYRWLEGDTVASTSMINLCEIATNLAQFLLALQRIDPIGGPLAGPDNFYRGGMLKKYDCQTRQAIAILKDKIDTRAVIEIWEMALEATWEKAPVWVHGDVSASNLLVQKGQLSAVIDFGQLAVGDPACDLTISWTLFEGGSREIFQDMLALDSGIWARGRAWIMWKALIVAAELTKTNAIGIEQAWRIINDVLADYRRTK